MSSTVMMEISRIEAVHLSDLVAQFRDLLDASDTSDPAVSRLVPDAYRDDEEAAAEFRRLTESDLISRRTVDAERVLADLEPHSVPPTDLDDPSMLATERIVLDAQSAQAWLRTLSAIRLVLATRLGIGASDTHADGDPRFGVYDWVGFRLDGLVRAVAAD